MDRRTNQRIGQVMMGALAVAVSLAVIAQAGWMSVVVFGGALFGTAWTIVAINLTVTGRWRG
jgi:hypothetical protein